MNRHFAEMLRALSAAGAEFLVVGAHAVAAHGHVRGTLDFDIWVRPDEENGQRVFRALAAFGAPMEEVSPKDFGTPGVIFQIGVKPVRIDIITALTGLESFNQAWANRIFVHDDENDLSYPVLGKDDLLRNKRATGRPQDLADVHALERV